MDVKALWDFTHLFSQPFAKNRGFWRCYILTIGLCLKHVETQLHDSF